MKLTDTLDQILRTLLATDRSSGDGPSPETATARPTLAGDLEAGVAARIEASGTAGDSAPRAEAVAPPRSTELARLETTVGVVEKLGLGFHLGSAVERIAAAATEGSAGGRKLHEATWLIERYLELLEHRPVGADLQMTMSRLAREGDAIAGLQALATALGEPPAPAEPAPRFSTALPSAQPETPPEPAPAAPQAQSPSLGRELALTGARALVVIAAVVVVVLVLTLISQLR